MRNPQDFSHVAPGGKLRESSVGVRIQDQQDSFARGKGLEYLFSLRCLRKTNKRGCKRTLPARALKEKAQKVLSAMPNEKGDENRDLCLERRKKKKEGPENEVPIARARGTDREKETSVQVYRKRPKRGHNRALVEGLRESAERDNGLTKREGWGRASGAPERECKGTSR